MREGQTGQAPEGGVPGVGPGKGCKPLTGVDGPNGWMDGLTILKYNESHLLHIDSMHTYIQLLIHEQLYDSISPKKLNFFFVHATFN